MRCAVATRELSAPSRPELRAEVERHVAECPACASFAEAGAAFDRVWSATRPAEPSVEAFDALWSAVGSAPAVSASVPFAMRSTPRRVFWSAAVLANAAAVVLMVRAFLPWPAPEMPAPPVLALHDIPIEQDVTCVIRINDDGVAVDRIEMDGSSAPLMALNSDISRLNHNDALNSLESMAE